MHLSDTGLLVSPTDLAGHHACPHLTQLDRAALGGHGGVRAASDPMMDLLAARGDEHERLHLERLVKSGLRVVSIPRPPYEAPALREAEALTLAAMRGGADVVYQATFFHEGRAGFSDFLRRVEQPSGLGGHSYEVHDTKLTAHVKVSAILQVCEYSTHVERLQGRMPDDVVLVLGDGTQSRLRVADHIAYYRAARARFDEDLSGARITVPEPCGHCVACPWSTRCQAEWRRDDALVLVAGITSSQRAKLRDVGVATVRSLAAREAAVPHLATPTLDRLRSQARLQVQERDSGEPHVELLDAGAGRGLAALPVPSPHDIFFDIEGDPLWPDGGLEYLLGAVGLGEGDPPFLALWAHDRAAEKVSFERFIDLVMARRHTDPTMHVYHYASYEVTAMKRLAARHATREVEVDELLRSGAFVDLLTVVRHGVRASKENYSLKSIEKFFMPHRDGDVKDAGTSVVEYERWMTDRDQSVLDSIEAYNRFDCISTARLRDWLEGLRAKAETAWGCVLDRPVDPDGTAPESVVADETANAELMRRLTDSADRDTADPARAHARALLGYLLGFHRREQRSQWWDYFAHHELSMEELVEDADSLGNVRHGGWVRREKRSDVHRFLFDAEQEHRIRVEHTVVDPTQRVHENEIGTVVEVGHGYVDIKMRGKADPEQVQALFPWSTVSAGPLVAALRDVAEAAIVHGVDGEGDFRAARDLLLRRAPRLRAGSGGMPSGVGDSASDTAVRLIGDLDGSTLAIQGPPGAGKTYTAARMAVRILSEPGRVIGITAPTHRAAGNLLEAVLGACAQAGVTARVIQRTSDADAVVDMPGVEQAGTNSDVATAIDRGIRVVVGTAWLFASPELRERVDVLFVDEAGQMSLANTVAAGTAAQNLVLLGDPQQLPQVLTGSHPDGASASALGHLLGHHATMPDDLGLFLDVTWRMHPTVCSLISELFYEGRLHPRDACAAQSVSGEAGLRFVPVEHAGCTGRSDEEVTAVVGVVRGLLDGATWTDSGGATAPMTAADILVVAPFNAQVEALRAALPDGVMVGTVDKFQGREAAVVVYSMACSTVDDAPRGVAFLYDRNRFNVAISRARALAVVVASPNLLDARCSLPGDVPPVNALCRYAELAVHVAPGSPVVVPAAAPVA